MHLRRGKENLKRYPTAVGLRGVNLLSALKLKAECGQPESATIESDALKADKQDGQADQVSADNFYARHQHVITT